MRVNCVDNLRWRSYTEAPKLKQSLQESLFSNWHVFEIYRVRQVFSYVIYGWIIGETRTVFRRLTPRVNTVYETTTNVPSAPGTSTGIERSVLTKKTRRYHTVFAKAKRWHLKRVKGSAPCSLFRWYCRVVCLHVCSLCFVPSRVTVASSSRGKFADLLEMLCAFCRVAAEKLMLSCFEVDRCGSSSAAGWGYNGVFTFWPLVCCAIVGRHQPPAADRGARRWPRRRRARGVYGLELERHRGGEIFFISFILSVHEVYSPVFWLVQVVRVPHRYITSPCIKLGTENQLTCARNTRRPTFASPVIA